MLQKISHKREEGKGGEKNTRESLHPFLKPPFPLSKQIALIPGMLIKSRSAWIRIQILLIPSGVDFESHRFNPSLSETETVMSTSQLSTEPDSTQKALRNMPDTRYILDTYEQLLLRFVLVHVCSPGTENSTRI